MECQDGHVFVKDLARFVRNHEKALANALQSQAHHPRSALPKRDVSNAKPSQIISQSQPSSTNALVAALSWGTLRFSPSNVKAVKLALTPHHLYYLLTQISELGISVGPLNIRLENIHTDRSPGNYVSFLSQHQRSRTHSDCDSIHSISSVRSVVSSMSNLWSGLRTDSTKSDIETAKARAHLRSDTTYVYSAFTKLPCLRLAPDPKARLVEGYEEFPFDTAVPLFAFKNVSSLEISDIDFRRFYGWDRVAEQLHSLTLKRVSINDLSEVIVAVVLDDVERRRWRSSKTQVSPTSSWPTSPWPTSPSMKYNDPMGPHFPTFDGKSGQLRPHSSTFTPPRRSETLESSHPICLKRNSQTKPDLASHLEGSNRHTRGHVSRGKRSESGSSCSSDISNHIPFAWSPASLLALRSLPPSKWRFLKYLSIADNALTTLNAACLTPLKHSLRSLDLSCNLFTEIPDCLSNLKTLRALNVSNCMIESLQNLHQCPLSRTVAINLRGNRLLSLSGIESSVALERLDLRDNSLRDPMELLKLTSIAKVHEIWVVRNPFTKYHSNYRTKIFNVFRSGTNFTEDVVIDGCGPSYSEKRHLQEIVPDPLVARQTEDWYTATEPNVCQNHGADARNDSMSLFKARQEPPFDESPQMNSEFDLKNSQTTVGAAAIGTIPITETHNSIAGDSTQETLHQTKPSLQLMVHALSGQRLEAPAVECSARDSLQSSQRRIDPHQTQAKSTASPTPFSYSLSIEA